MNTIIFLLTVVTFGAGLYKLFEKAGHPGWKAAVPVLNLLIWAQITGRKPITLLWLLVPIVNIFTFAYMLIELVNSFGRWGFWQQFAAVVCPYIYYPMLGFAPTGAPSAVANPVPEEPKRRTGKAANQAAAAPVTNEVNYMGPSLAIPKDKLPKKGPIREWAEAVLFAVFAASFIRMFLIEAYTIPTPSMEGSLLVGDFLFVSKIHYGARTPTHPLSLPLVHNTIPGTNMESYINWPIWESYRTPGLVEIQRNDPFVFNFPEGDTIIPGMDFPDQYHNRIHRGERRENVLKQFNIVARPVDKRDHYVKRCVGLPGDKIEVRDGQLYVNDQPAQNPSKLQITYMARTTQPIDQFLSENEDIELLGKRGNEYYLTLNAAEAEALRQIPAVDSMGVYTKPKGMYQPLFPFDPAHYQWNVDNYGPLVLPKAGEVLQLTPENISLYLRIIQAYEGNTFENRNGKYFINGQETTTYTCRQNYYWAMGDNRHNSADSRSWGYVPEDHIVGKPLFIWMSLKGGSLANGIRWDRLFRSASAD